MTKERPELSKERIENVIFRMRREGDIQAFETVMALHARVQELEAKAKVRLSIPPVQLQHYRTALEAIAAGNTDPDGMVALAASALSATPAADAPMVDMTPPATSRDRWMYEQGRLAERDARTPGSVAVAAPVVSDAQIKTVFLANGFTIKEGMTDLKPYVYQAARALLAAGGQAQAVERIAIDMKQTAELLDLFGGEPTEFTVMQCNGHSGPGLYAYVTEYPEDGASYLGKTDCEAQPAPQAQAAASTAGHGLEQFIEQVGDVHFQRCRVGSKEGAIRWDIEFGHYGVEVRGKTLREAITKAIAAQAKQGEQANG